ncbi:MAG: hypothetical protein ACYDCN_08485 [Bacteroidia bacterium]
MMLNITEPYNQQKVDNIFQYLQDNKEQGEPEDFEIFVDSFKVVKRTNDLTRFENYTNHIQPDTKSITISIFDGTSNRNTKHIFKLIEDKKEEKKEEKQTLSGAEIDNRMDERIKAERERWDNEQLRKEHEKLKKELEDSESYADQLEKDLVISQNRKPDTTFSEVAGVILEGVVRRNPQIVSQIPGGDALAGLIIKDNEEKQKLLEAPPQTEPKVSFKLKETNNQSTMKEPETKTTTTQEPLSEQDKASLVFIKQLNATFNREQLTKVFQLLDLLAKHPEDIDKNIQFLSDLHKE